MKPEGEELTTSTDDLSLSLPLSLDKNVWLSFLSNCRARLLKAILEELLEVKGQRRSEIIGASRRRSLFQVQLSEGNQCHIYSRCHTES